MCRPPTRSRARWRCCSPRVWRGSGAATPRYELKAAALAVGCLLATPYVLDYDLVVLAIAIAFFARHGFANGFRDYEITLLAAAWVVPLLARGIAARPAFRSA